MRLLIYFAILVALAFATGHLLAACAQALAVTR